MRLWRAMNHNVKIRNIKPGDSQAVLAIRNSLEVYRFCRNARQIRPEEHAHWFAKRAKQKNGGYYFIATLNDEVAGYLRYDLVGDIYDIAIAIFPKFHKKGVGSCLLQQTLSKVQKEGRKIQAEVQKDNIASIRFFEKHGFIRLREKDNSIIFNSRNNLKIYVE